jgi:hypothetical protein
MTAEEPDDDLLSAEEIAAEIKAAGIPLTAGNLQAMIAATRAGAEQTKVRAVELFPLKPMMPVHVSYEVGRRAAASHELPAQKLGGDWFVTKADVAEWLKGSPSRWFKSESAVAKWLAYIAQLEPRSIP